MLEFYTNVTLQGNAIYYRGIKNDRQVIKKIAYAPTLYVKTQKSGDTAWKTIEGHRLEERKFSSVWDARNFCKDMERLETVKVYGNQKYQYACIADLFPNDINFDVDRVRVAFMDIEVVSTEGFPNVAKADQAITAITIYDSIRKKFYAFAYKDNYVPKRADVEFIKCDDELDLMYKFILMWKENCPDIITGWNVNLFDVPYLINRMKRVGGEELATLLSPWGILTQHEKTFNNKTFQTYDIVGIATLDYLDVYKKYSKNPSQPSYKLENIGQVELKIGKIDYSGYKNLNDLYERNFELYMDYNIHDVNIVVLLNAKQRLMELCMTLSWVARVNFDDVFSQGRIWDAIIFNRLKKRNVAIPPMKDFSKSREFEGAYVKEPKPGRYRRVASFDLDGLYPHLIMQYNLSPETLLEPTDYDEEVSLWLRRNGAKVNVDSLLNQELDLDILKVKQLTITPNGQLFRTDIKGFLPEIMQEMYDSRKEYKNKMIDAKKKAEKETNEETKAELKNLIAKFDVLQSAFKVTLNSAYGSIGNEFFRFFDVRIAEAVTLSGQLSIRWIQKKLNEYFNALMKTKNADYVCYSDTDSVYVVLDKIIDKVMTDTSDVRKVIQAMDRICEQKIAPFITKSYSELADYVNAYEQKMSMKREALADQAIWTAKKRYVMNVYNNEGVEYKEPEIKVTGLEMVKSTTPNFCKPKLKEATKIILNGTEDQLIDYIDKFREEFKKAPFIDIGKPTGVNGLGEYGDKKLIWQKGTPSHIKGTLVYNHYLDHFGLLNKYEPIREGEKVRLLNLKEPNPFQCNVICFSDQIPEEFDIIKYIDFEKQFEKTFIDPIKIMVRAVDWRFERSNSLEDFFT